MSRAESNRPNAERCPKCGSQRVYRSHRRLKVDGLVRTLFCSAYSCHACRHRHYRIKPLAVAAGAFSLLLLVFLIVFGWIFWSHYAPEVPLVVKSGNAASPVKQAEPVAETAAAETSPPHGQSLTEMAERGDARAQYLLGKAYLNGQGNAKDLALAVEWFEKAAMQGNADAQFALGMIFLTGRGALQHYETAYEWFEKAAMQNHADAQYRLGTMLRNGDGVAEDKVKAYIWFNLAAAQGHDRAAEARDSLLPALTDEQIARGQREAHAWRPVATKR